MSNSKLLSKLEAKMLDLEKFTFEFLRRHLSVLPLIKCFRIILTGLLSLLFKPDGIASRLGRAVSDQ